MALKAAVAYFLIHQNNLGILLEMRHFYKKMYVVTVLFQIHTQ